MLLGVRELGYKLSGAWYSDESWMCGKVQGRCGSVLLAFVVHLGKDCPQMVTLLFDCPGACARRQLQRPSGTGHGPGAPGLCKGSEWFAWGGGQSLADVPP